MVSSTRMMTGGKKSRSKSMPALYSDSEHISVSVRKIKNGFVVNKSVSGPSGYDSDETYHPKRPKIDVQSIPHIGEICPPSKVNSNALRRAAGNKKVKDT